MTRKPAIQVCLFFLVTLNAESHPEMNPFDPVHGLYNPMAFLAGYLLFYMPFMSENHMFRKIIDLPPWCGSTGIKIPMLFFDLRVVGNYIFMTVDAFFDGRNPRMFGTVHIGMAKFTADLLDTRMNSVAKGDRLFGSDIHYRQDIKEI